MCSDDVKHSSTSLAFAFLSFSYLQRAVLLHRRCSSGHCTSRGPSPYVLYCLHSKKMYLSRWKAPNALFMSALFDDVCCHLRSLKYQPESQEPLNARPFDLIISLRLSSRFWAWPFVFLSNELKCNENSIIKGSDGKFYIIFITFFWRTAEDSKIRGRVNTNAINPNRSLL